MGIRVESVSAKEVGGLTVYVGRVAQGQVGYRAMAEEELEPRSSPGVEHGYRSWGTFNTKVERGSRGSTMFSSAPLTADEMQRHGYTHMIEADLSGLPFRTLRAPVDGVVHADLGLGLGIVGEMDWSRIRRAHGPSGQVVPDSAPHIGQQFKDMVFEETGRWPRGQ